MYVIVDYTHTGDYEIFPDPTIEKIYNVIPRYEENHNVNPRYEGNYNVNTR